MFVACWKGSDMRWPWTPVTRSVEERQAAERSVLAVRSHLRILVNELNVTLDRIADKAERLSHDG